MVIIIVCQIKLLGREFFFSTPLVRKGRDDIVKNVRD